MCGIFGYVTTKPEKGGRAVLETALQALHHRGPDDSSLLEIHDEPLECGLAHTRLAIIDLSPNGRQPMTTPDGRYTIVYNGEVYNFPELRAKLEALGVRFRGSCDTEVILEAYAQWGTDAIARFRGMFAFGIWDRRERKLVLARDHMGIKPLYFTSGPGYFAFTSEVRALVRTGFSAKTISRRAVASYLSTGSVSEPDTIVSDIAPLPPGTILEYSNGSVSSWTYWSVPVEPSTNTSMHAAVDDVRSVLADAIRLRLIADVPLGVFLSSGIDSTTIASFAARTSSSPIRTFTVTFEEESFSEGRIAAETARRIGSNHCEVRLAGRDTLSSIDDVMMSLDQPSHDGFNTYIVSKAARQSGLSVALSGLGGDEVFAGYGGFGQFGLALAIGRLTRRISPYLDRAASVVTQIGRVPHRIQKFADLLRAGGSPSKTYATLRSMFGVEQIRQLISPEFAEDAPFLPVTIPPGFATLLERGDLEPENAYSALELSNYLRDTLLRDADVMSMRHALEVRVPLVDHVLIEHVLRLPAHVKLDRKVNKPLLTQAVGDLPNNVLRKAKMGFCLPFGDWLRGPLRPWAEEMLLGAPIRRLPFLNARAAADIWQAFLQRRVAFSRVFCLTALVAYFDSHALSVD
ncbi:MAG: asparagine synthase (glutamine-hydrolyzing) [Polyangiaceae bacterium]|nr:asparagine synthase (glutamine-hydrolyzing) [Polyangiaceae bacterium]